MDRMITTPINGVDRELNYSIEVMFNMADRFGNIQKALDIIEQDGLAGFEAVRWFAIQMANDAELCRRDAGYEPRPMLTENVITPRIKPLDYEILKENVVNAIVLGYRRDLPEAQDEEVDLGLAELRAKKATAGE